MMASTRLNRPTRNDVCRCWINSAVVPCTPSPTLMIAAGSCRAELMMMGSWNGRKDVGRACWLLCCVFEKSQGTLTSALLRKLPVLRPGGGVEAEEGREI